LGFFEESILYTLVCRKQQVGRIKGLLIFFSSIPHARKFSLSFCVAIPNTVNLTESLMIMLHLLYIARSRRQEVSRFSQHSVCNSTSCHVGFSLYLSQRTAVKIHTFLVEIELAHSVSSPNAVKQSLYTPWRRLGGEEVELLHIHDLGTRWGWVVSITPGAALYPRGRDPGTHCTGGWVGPRAGLDTEARGKILCPRRGSNPDRP
jgi:hypothetical protein